MNLTFPMASSSDARVSQGISRGNLVQRACAARILHDSVKQHMLKRVKVGKGVPRTWVKSRLQSSETIVLQHVQESLA